LSNSLNVNIVSDEEEVLESVIAKPKAYESV